VPRPVAAVTDDTGITADFVSDELTIVTDDQNALNAFLGRWHGQILRTIDPAQAGWSGISRLYLVRLDASPAAPAALVADTRATNGLVGGSLRVTDDAGLHLLAVAAAENAGGLTVLENWVMHDHDAPNLAQLSADLIARVTTDDATRVANG